MKTAKYQFSRVIVQGISLVMIIANFCVFTYIYLFEIQKIEHEISTKPSFFLSDLNIYTTAINLLFFSISAGCITSKSKIWMRVCEKLLYIHIGFTCSAAFYFYCFYFNAMTTAISNGFGEKKLTFVMLLKSFNIPPKNNSITEGFIDELRTVINIFCGFQLAVAFTSYIQSKLLYYTANIKLEKTVKQPPKLNVADKVGAQGMTEIMKRMPKMSGGLRV